MSEVEKISTENFKIENNIISFSNSLIQVSNISRVCVAPTPKKKFNFLSLLAFAIGVMLVQTYGEVQQSVGIACIIGVIVYAFYYICSNTDEKHLNVYLNSGNVYCIMCKDTQFLDRVMQVIEYCINNHSSQKIKIDFDNCKLYNSPVTVGDKNEVN